MANQKKVVRSVEAPDAVAAGAATDVSDLFSMQAQLYFTGTGTYQFQVSYDGTNFVNHGSALTAAGVVATAIPDAVKKVRWNCTVDTSATAQASSIAGVKYIDPGW